MKKFYFLTMFLFAALLINAQTMVTFAVDMNGVTEFTAGTNVLKVAGDFQGWDVDTAPTELTDPDGNGVYAVTVSVDAASISYKYVIDAWGTNEFHPDFPGTPTDDCTLDDGAGNINRIADISGATQNLPVYIYNTCDVSDLGVNVNELTTIQDLEDYA